MRIYKKSIIFFGILVTVYICFTLRTSLKIPPAHPLALENSIKIEEIIKQDASQKRDEVQRKAASIQTQDAENHSELSDSKDAKCNINGEQTIKCLRSDNEIFIPFNFVKEYFEIYGDVKGNTLFWQHSNARVIMLGPEGYQWDGVFMSFDHYNVEGRERVFCLTGAEGVPHSTQWARKPYPYAIQIAQFGLSHYSKLLRENKDKPVARQTIGSDKNDWDISDDCDFNIDDNGVVAFSCPQRSAAQLPLTEIPVSLATMTLDVSLAKGASATLISELAGRREVQLIYTPANFLLHVSRDKKFIKYGIGPPGKWTQLIRMPKVDIRKGFLSTASGKKARKRKKRLGHRRRNSGEQADGAHIKMRSYRKLVLRGSGKIRGLTFSTTNHRGMFLQAARWHVRHQTDAGGWPVPVRRKFGSTKLGILPPGWHSAMAQGHGMSLLARAYKLTGNTTFLEAALRGTKIFETPVKAGGVRTTFADKFVWYEEYPTTPSLFVLNGFIYSLMGLYDVAQAADPSDRGSKAFELYNKGLESLNAMLPLFDTGSGTFYDLRHVTLHSTPNLARWDYHATHITQLLLLHSINKENPLWHETATRWMSYTRGQRAPHN